MREYLRKAEWGFGIASFSVSHDRRKKRSEVAIYHSIQVILKKKFTLVCEQTALKTNVFCCFLVWYWSPTSLSEWTGSPCCVGMPSTAYWPTKWASGKRFRRSPFSLTSSKKIPTRVRIWLWFQVPLWVRESYGIWYEVFNKFVEIQKQEYIHSIYIILYSVFHSRFIEAKLLDFFSCLLYFAMYQKSCRTQMANLLHSFPTFSPTSSDMAYNSCTPIQFLQKYFNVEIFSICVYYIPKPISCFELAEFFC